MTIPRPTAEDMDERAEIDRAARWPVLFFLTSAAAWLLVASVLGFLSSLKLRVPDLVDEIGFLTYGRLFPMHLHALVYGWAMQAGFGVLLWMFSRLTRNPISQPITLIVIGHVWNAAVSLSLLSILAGYGRSIPLLDFPKWIGVVILLAYAATIVWVIPMFRARRDANIYVSEKYLIGAAVWFPWVFTAANIFVNRETSPVMGAGVAAWYVSNLIYFWMVPMTLGMAYYLVPKIAARPLHSASLANLSFWVLAFLAGWTGFSRFLGGPFPAWMTAVSAAATVFILLAIVAAVGNLILTLKGVPNLWNYSPTLRFGLSGLLMLPIFAVLAAISGTEFGARFLQFSHFVVGLDTLAVYGFFSMTLFGAIYFIVPRLTGCEWPSNNGIRTHFWWSVYGIITLVVTMLLGGIAQGTSLAQWDQAFSTSTDMSSGATIGRIIAWAFLTFANLRFLFQLGLMFIGKGRKTGGATMLHFEPGTATDSRAAATVGHH
ncbi:MAG: cbb3-type cytochrome c oxidase subunit I [Verrucomicrobiota bacterium]